MGTVPHVFAVVKSDTKKDDFYHLAFFQRPAVGQYKPPTPPFEHSFDTDATREYLFTKLHNGFLRANACPPLDRLFKVPRREAIKTLGTKYPAETTK